MSKLKQLTGKVRNLLNKITVKQVLLIILFGLIISLASCIIGYSEFSATIKETYNDKSQEIAQVIRDNLNIDQYEKDMKDLADKFYRYDQPIFEQISQQPSYKELVKQATYLRNSIDGLDIYIGDYSETYDKNYLKYLETESPDEEVYNMITKENNKVVCTYYRSPSLTPKDRKSDQPGGLFLANGPELEALNTLYKDKSPQFLETELVMGDDSNKRFTSFSVEEPILNQNGDLIGFIGVSITTSVLQNLLHRYLLLVGCLTVLIGVVFILIYISINRRMFIKPILSIIRGTSSFVENNNQISESLKEIKTGDEIQTLAESILKLETDINEYIKNLAEATKERERVQAELDLATNIQMSMLPQEIPEIAKREEFEISAIMNPAREVGGDFYNYFMIDDDHLGFVVGDVSGKGVPAALFMMLGTVIIQTQSLPGEPVNSIIEKANDILSENNAEMLFITAWMGIYEISTGTVTFINAGHEPPLLVHEDGEVQFIKTKPNLALATFGGLPYKLYDLKLQKGDKIFVYTDGVVEAQNEAQEFYEFDRLEKIVKANYKHSVKEIIKDIRQDIDKFADGAEQFDDITIVGLEVKQDPEEFTKSEFKEE